MARGRRYRDEVKWNVIRAYGGRCACCGETELIFLTIDHIDGGGRRHLQMLSREGTTIYLWLRKHGYPDGYQVLCFNCNFAKAHGGCPHRGGMRTEIDSPAQLTLIDAYLL